VTTPLERLRTPIHVLLGEAVEAARVWECHWTAERDASGRVKFPGFELAVPFLFDDGKEDENDARLAVIQEAHRDSLSQDAVALALEAFAALAEQHRDRMSGLGGFDVALIDEAGTLAKRLREHSAGKLVGEPTNAQRAALDLRNRIATLLVGRMAQMRTAARFVFRGHPEVVRKMTSAWQRKKRAEGRKGEVMVEE